MEYLKSIVPIIESNYDNFTTVEKTIADFFIHNREKMDFSAKSVSDLLFVSAASLSRFAQKCGFKGYREFIYQYEECFIEKKEAMTTSTRAVLNIYQEMMNKTYNLVDERQIHRLCRYLSAFSRVFICGKGSSGLAARETEIRFMRVGVDIDSIIEGDMMRMQAVFQDKNSLSIGFSISGETEDVLYFLKEAHKRQAKTVLFTSKNKAEFNEFCDEIILLPSLLHLSSGSVISPQFPLLLLVDIWYASFVSRNKYQIETLHDSTLKALRERQQSMYRPLD